MGRNLAGPDVGVGDVLAATEALASSFEVVDSRIIHRKFSLVDTNSDNASYGAFCVGRRDSSLRDVDLRTLGVLARARRFPSRPAMSSSWSCTGPRRP
jgi:2-keto-4-pentenoate hydratase